MPSSIVPNGEHTLTPDEWAVVLERTHYPGQRQLNEAKLARLARLDEQGHFRAGEMLTFAGVHDAQFLVDGQHRLTAATRRTVPTTFVGRTIPCDSMDAVADLYCQFDEADAGQARNARALVASLPTWLSSLAQATDVRMFWNGIGALARRPDFAGPAATHFDKIEVAQQFQAELRALSKVRDDEHVASLPLIRRRIIERPTFDACLAILGEPDDTGTRFLRGLLSAEGDQMTKTLAHTYLSPERVFDATGRGIQRLPVSQRRRRRFLVAWNVFRGKYTLPQADLAMGLSQACFARSGRGNATAMQPYESPNGLTIVV
ncbi:MAG: hypothetical protein F4Y02_12940 [Chloroflexi bacterium]|nr:hypothetical protein [Chloroflexota bacterium]